MSFEFKKQLKVGDQGEEIILARYPRVLEKQAKHDYDFDILCYEQKLEVKTDTYNMDKTVNFFMERYSDVNKKDTKPGGPWQSLGKGVDVFCYLFLNNQTFFVFPKLDELVDRLDELTHKKGLVYIKNRGYTTGGYKVKREDVKDLYHEYRYDIKDSKRAKKVK